MSNTTRFHKWVRFAMMDPEAGADWLAYWREQNEPRPEVAFYRTDDNMKWLASELAGSGRQWSHDDTAVTWQLITGTVIGALPVSRS